MAEAVVRADLDQRDLRPQARSSAGRPGSALPWCATFMHVDVRQRKRAGHLAFRVGREEHVEAAVGGGHDRGAQVRVDPGGRSRARPRTAPAGAGRARPATAGPRARLAPAHPRARASDTMRRWSAPSSRQPAVQQQADRRTTRAPRRARPDGPPAHGSTPRRRASHTAVAQLAREARARRAPVHEHRRAVGRLQQRRVALPHVQEGDGELARRSAARARARAPRRPRIAAPARAAKQARPAPSCASRATPQSAAPPAA